MKRTLFLLIILSSVGFFNPFQIVPPTVQKGTFYLFIIAAVAYAIARCPSIRDVRYPRVAYFTVIASIFCSAFMATAFHPQSLLVSIMTTLPFWMAFVTLWILLKFNLSPHVIMRSMLVLMAIAIFVYFSNLYSMPYNIYGDAVIGGEDMTRGILRVPVVFIVFFPVMTFYAINRWMDTRNWKWIIIGSVCMVMIFLSVTRQLIAYTLVLGILFIMESVSWKKKLVVIFVSVAVVVWVLPLIPIYSTMIELSESQAEENEVEEENIRITAFRYYTYENQTNALSPIFGNGIASFGNSMWGTMMETETDENGCFYVDVGWAGFFWLFGAIGTTALIVLFYKALRRPKPPHLKYVNYSLWMFILLSIASGPIVYYHQITLLCIVFYFAFRPYDDDPEMLESAQHSSALPSSTDEAAKTKRTQRFPQLRSLRSSR